MSTKPSYCDELTARREAAGMTHADLRAALIEAGYRAGKKKPSLNTMRKWLSGHQAIPKSLIPFLAQALGMKETTWARVDADYEVWLTDRDVEEEDLPPEADDLIEQIDKATADALKALETAAAKTAELFDHMGPDHFFVSTSTTLRMKVLEPENAAHDGLIAARAEATMRGALFAMITPTPELSDRLLGSYRFEEGEENHHFLERFDRLRGDVAVRLRNLGVDDADEVAHARMQRFETAEFPLTPAGWTVSLYGHRRELGRSPDLRVIVRGQLNDVDKLVLWPEADGRFAGWLAGFVRRVLRTRRSHIALQPAAERAPPVQREYRFIQCMLERMLGNPDPEM